MLNRKYLLFFLVVLWAGLFATAGEKIEEKKAGKQISEPAAAKSLIRKDLLFAKRVKLSPPQRNIFSPLAERQTQAETLPQEMGTSQTTASQSREDSEESSGETKPDLRYIGYVKSAQKIIALVIFEGEALAVAENEMISAEIQVGKVTSEEIELIDARAQKWKYSLEGEEE